MLLVFYCFELCHLAWAILCCHLNMHINSQQYSLTHNRRWKPLCIFNGWNDRQKKRYHICQCFAGTQICTVSAVRDSDAQTRIYYWPSGNTNSGSMRQQGTIPGSSSNSAFYRLHRLADIRRLWQHLLLVKKQELIKCRCDRFAVVSAMSLL